MLSLRPPSNSSLLKRSFRVFEWFLLLIPGYFGGSGYSLLQQAGEAPEDAEICPGARALGLYLYSRFSYVDLVSTLLLAQDIRVFDGLQGIDLFLGFM